MKKSFSDKEAKSFIMAYGSGKPIQEKYMVYGNVFRSKIKNMINICNRMGIKNGFGKTNLVVEDVEELIMQQQGVCPTWKVNFVYTFNTLFMPSIDRKDHQLPHILGNNFVSTWGVNSFRGKKISVDGAKEFAFLVFKSEGGLVYC